MTNDEFLQFVKEIKSNEPNEPNETPEPVELTDEQKLFYYHEQEIEERAYFESQQQH